jgi:hypothetical protein
MFLTAVDKVHIICEVAYHVNKVPSRCCEVLYRYYEVAYRC